MRVRRSNIKRKNNGVSSSKQLNITYSAIVFTEIKRNKGIPIMCSDL